MPATKKAAGIASAASEVAFYARALKAPRIPDAAESMAGRARDEGWDYQQFLAAVLAEEVTARESHGGAARVKAARFPQVKTLDDFDFGFQRSIDRTVVSHLAQLDFLREAKNVVFLGPPGTGRTHLSIALGVQAARRGHRVAFATAHQWVQRLTAAQRAGQLDTELERLGRTPLLIIDEVGYIPFDPDAAALLFALISSRYERASMIVSSNKTLPGPRSSATRSPLPPSLTASCTTPRSSYSVATATASKTKAKTCSEPTRPDNCSDFNDRQPLRIQRPLTHSDCAYVGQ